MQLDQRLCHGTCLRLVICSRPSRPSSCPAQVAQASPRCSTETGPGANAASSTAAPALLPSAVPQRPQPGRQLRLQRQRCAGELGTRSEWRLATLGQIPVGLLGTGRPVQPYQKRRSW